MLRVLCLDAIKDLFTHYRRRCKSKPDYLIIEDLLELKNLLETNLNQRCLEHLWQQDHTGFSRIFFDNRLVWRAALGSVSLPSSLAPAVRFYLATWDGAGAIERGWGPGRCNPTAARGLAC